MTKEQYNKELKSYYCYVCENEEENREKLTDFNKVYCKRCKTIHYVCGMCRDNGHGDDLNNSKGDFIIN